MTSCTGSVRGGFGGFEKVSELSSCLGTEELGFSFRGRRLTFGARRRLVAGGARDLGQMGKSA